MPPVKLHWYDGGLLPERPEDLEPERTMPESGTIFVGDKGKMWCETYSESPRLIPETAMQAFQRPPRTLPRVPEGRAGHEKNWLDAIRQKGQAVSNFDYAGPFTEAVLLGNVALRYPGQRLLWDAATLKITNLPEADQFVQPPVPHRDGRCSDGHPCRSGRRWRPLRTCRTHACRRTRPRTAGSGSREPRASATCGATRMRRCTPSSRCMPCTPTNGTRRRRRRRPSISRTGSSAS